LAARQRRFASACGVQPIPYTGDDLDLIVVVGLDILSRQVGHRDVVPMLFGLEDEQSAVPLSGRTLQPQPKVRAQFQRHIETREAAAAIKLDARDVVYRLPAFQDQVEYPAEAGRTRVAEIKRATRDIAAPNDRKTHRTEKRLVVWIEGAVDEDG
jgi:hypothetical protein